MPKGRRSDSDWKLSNERPSDDGAEQGVGDQIAAPEPSRLLFDAVEPFEAKTLPDQRRSANLSREHVERAANAVAHWDAELGAPVGEKALLPR